MEFLGEDIAPLGMGCWPIGGPFFRGAQPLGYANSEDGESVRTLHAALDHGVRLFDTAAVYGAGHAERLMGEALKDRPEAIIISKIGIAFDEDTKQLAGDDLDPVNVLPAIERCLRRLQRDRIDMMLLHQNALPLEQAAPIFEAMEAARQSGLIRSYGWSTDFPDSAKAMAGKEGFVAVEHAMNLFFDAPRMQGVVAQTGLIALLRSPLAMGILSGKYDATTVMDPSDIRSTNEPARDYYEDGRVQASFLDPLNAVRELLQTDGRSVAQGALCWLMAKSPQNVPLPGARTVQQMVDNAEAVAFGPLPAPVMAEIEGLMTRDPEGPPRPR